MSVNTPEYKRLWEIYFDSYRKLETKIKEAGLDVLLLQNFINARTRIDVYELQCRINDALRKHSKKVQGE